MQCVAREGGAWLSFDLNTFPAGSTPAPIQRFSGWLKHSATGAILAGPTNVLPVGGTFSLFSPLLTDGEHCWAVVSSNLVCGLF